MASLSLERRLLCGRCGVCRPGEGGTMIMELRNSVGAAVGEEVLVRILPSNLKISFFLYGIPSIFFVCGLFLGYFLLRSEPAALLGGLLFLAASLLPLRAFSRRNEPRIERILDRSALASADPANVAVDDLR